MKSKRVLIVDDNDLNRKLFENLIGQVCQFDSAKNGLEALDLLKKAAYDLIIMDIQMPLMDGLTAMKQIKLSKISDSPIIAVTAFAELEDKNTYLDQGFDDFVTKPIRPRDFLENVKKTLKSKNPIQETPHSESIHDPITTTLDLGTVRQLMKYNSGETIRNVYLDFLKETEMLIDEILSLNSENNLDSISEKLHILKGNSGTLGANQIYLLAKEGEYLARNNQWDQKKNLLQDLQLEILNFKKYLKEETIFE